MPRHLKLSGNKTFVLEQGVDFFTQWTSKLLLVTTHLYAMRSTSSRRICEAEVSSVVMNCFILSKKDCLLLITSLVATSWLLVQYKTWKEITCMLTNDMQMRCKWYSWVETAAVREIVLPCLSLPEHRRAMRSTEWCGDRLAQNRLESNTC